ncbi:MAG: glycerol-3-phosphate 1-O-acyltransferase PlsY [Betaproteobacteria bacterium]|nr:glycerol-3-phosphate 1-O-acyltransferase PlsY [Betaproteobacteria bacterium]
MTAQLIAITLGYFIGAIPFAVVVSRAMRLPDPRTYGSSNPGATNVLRSGSKVAAILTLLGDAVKGWVAVVLAQHFAPQFGLDATTLALVGLAAFLGHLFPVWLGFKGGKGVATAAGVLIAFNGWLGLATIGVWLAVVALSRYSSLGALVAAVFAPIGAGYFLGSGIALVVVILMSALLIWRHAANIRKLANGEESRIGDKKKAAFEPVDVPRQ